MTKKLSIAICQMKVSSDKEENLEKVAEMLQECSRRGAEMAVLPEIFNAPYQADLFPDYAEYYPGPSTDFLAGAARDNEICIIGGSIIEKDIEGRIFNSCFVFDDTGQLIGRHRKVHLFDIDIPGQISFKESDTLSAGNKITLITHNSISWGLMICYDCRFPELARAASLEGAQMLIIPAAFNLTTGAAHWELLMRSRAVDNQLFVIAASPARNPEATYQAWGHSMIVDPWGKIVAEADDREQILYAELDFSILDKVRKELPLLKQRRTDLYQLNYKQD